MNLPKSKFKWLFLWLLLLITFVGLGFLINLAIQNIFVALEPDPEDSQWSGLGFLLGLFVAAPFAFTGFLYVMLAEHLSKSSLTLRTKRILKVANMCLLVMAGLWLIMLFAVSFI